MEEILRFEHVSYAYEEEREALLDVCVKVCAGERVAVLGSNGAGKSTFFLLANGVLRPGAGRILFRGAPVGGLTIEKFTLTRSEKISTLSIIINQHLS